MKAMVIGATGLVGREMVLQLLEDQSFSSVTVFARKSSELSHPKLIEHLVNFDDLPSWAPLLKGDVLFSAMGTTLKTAGSKSAQYKIDYEYQLKVAQQARENGACTFVLVSSNGANPNSPFFYLKMKGELEEAIKQLGFISLIILRPGPLAGERKEVRKGERISHLFLSRLPKVKAFSGMLPVAATEVARFGIKWAKSKVTGVVTLGPDEMLF